MLSSHAFLFCLTAMTSYTSWNLRVNSVNIFIECDSYSFFSTLRALSLSLVLFFISFLLYYCMMSAMSPAEPTSMSTADKDADDMEGSHICFCANERTMTFFSLSQFCFFHSCCVYCMYMRASQKKRKEK
jgi:hypothetical protein